MESIKRRLSFLYERGKDYLQGECDRIYQEGSRSLDSKSKNGATQKVLGRLSLRK